MINTKNSREKNNIDPRNKATGKRIAAVVVAAVFLLGCMWIPGSEYAGEANAAEKTSPDYVDGEVVVCYIDPGDMNLTARQEKKSDKMLGDSEKIMTIDNVSLGNVTVDESLLDKSIQKSEEVDKTLAVVSSETKSTEDMISEIEKLPNVDYVEPNYIFSLTEGEEAVESGQSEQPVQPVQDEAAGEEKSQDEATGESKAVDTPEAEQENTETSVTEDYSSKQWGFNGQSIGMNIPEWNVPSNVNAGGVVAVLDTGINYRHEDLVDVMWKDGAKYDELVNMGGGEYGIDCSQLDYNDDGTKVEGSVDNDPMDDHGHGSHVAGIIAAEWNGIGISGAANGAKLMAVKAGKSDGKFSYAALLRGYDYIIKAKELGVDVVAINNSWGGLADSGYGLNDAITRAGEKGVVSVFASGNEGNNCDRRYVYSDENGKIYYYRYNCYFYKDNPYKVVVNNTYMSSLWGSSNYGASTTDVAAPGTDIISTAYDANNKYVYMTGTSMAAPAVSGEVAILAEMDNNKDASVIASIVKQNTTANGSLSGRCTSGGIANVKKALGADSKLIKHREFSVSNAVYDGYAKYPAVHCRNLTQGKNYNVSYANNVLPGTAMVTVSGNSPYVGAVTLTFRVVIKPTSISKLSKLKRGFKVKAAKQSKKLVNGYQVRYSLNSNMAGAKNRTIGKKYNKVTKTVKGLKKNRNYYVQARTYKTIGKTKYYSDWSAVRGVRTR